MVPIRLVWRHVAAAWRAFCPGHSWAASAEQEGRPSDDACRAILLGLRPDGEHTLREPFALLRGLAMHETRPCISDLALIAAPGVRVPYLERRCKT